MKAGLILGMAGRGMGGLMERNPLCVSFEVTHSCPADCLHCDKGRIKKEERLMGPDDYRIRTRELHPGVCQLSGGEPLTRKDLEQIVAAVKGEGAPPYLICVTNSWLLTEERYLALIEAGVDIFSISLDFPDDRHDEFRQLPGLFARMKEMIPRLSQTYGRNNIVLNTALTRANFKEIPALVEKAEEWGVKISFSAYSVLRTGDADYCIQDPEDLDHLRSSVDYLQEHKRTHDTVITTPRVLERTYGFFHDGGAPGCQAGVRFLVVRPDGLINACSMFPDRRFRTREEAVAGFAERLTCDQCYVSIRALTERGLGELAIDNIKGYVQMR